MKNIKYWHVKLYQHTQNACLIMGAAAAERLLHEGYSKDEVSLPPRDGRIKLLTEPCGIEVKTVRADAVDSIVCTPVYEGEDEAKADSDAANGRYNYDTFKAAAKPLIQWLNENANPHASVIVDCTSAELLTGEIAVYTKEFLKD
jgi:hypothetical protein